MRVSPLDIRKQEFTRAFRGYEVEEVNAFLQMIAREFEEARDDHRRLEEQVRSLEEKIRHYERVEEALQEALQTARDSSRKAVQNAEERARLIVQNAEAKATEITRDAHASLETMRAETSRLGNRQHEIVARLRAFLTAETEMLNRFEQNELDASAEAVPGISASPAMAARSSATHASVRPSRPATEPPRPQVEPQRRPEPAPETEDEEPEDVFNPAAEAEDDDSQPIRSGAFNVRSLIARARAVEETEADDDDLEDPEIVDELLADADDADASTAPDSRRGRQATEEIEKIRRILNDLD